MSLRSRRENTASSVSASVSAGRNAVRRLAQIPLPDVIRSNPWRGNDGQATKSTTATMAMTPATTSPHVAPDLLRSPRRVAPMIVIAVHAAIASNSRHTTQRGMSGLNTNR